jgi:hypothetical protein
LKKPHALFGLLAAVGTVIGVIVAVVGLPYGQLNYTAFAGLYHYGGTPAIGTVDLSIDCDTTTSGIQDMCNVPFGPGTRDVAIVVENNTAASFSVGSFNFSIVNPDTSKINAPGCSAATPNVASPPYAVCSSGVPADTKNANPDFDPAVTGTWACTPPDPLADDEGVSGYPDDASDNPATQHSFLSCFSAPGNGPTVAPGDTLQLAIVHYDTLYTGPSAMTVTLSTVNFSMGDNNGAEVGSCNPGIGVPVPCFPADLNFTPAPTDTPTNTPTVTNTPLPATNTPTATNTPNSPVQSKSPEGNANNTGVGPDGIPEANLYLCQPNFAPYHLGALGNPTVSYNAAQTGETCGGPGEGDLLVFEHVDGISTNPATLGAGAYEFSVEYDNFVIQSVNPCDLVFNPANNVVSGKGGAGDPPRGPVDQVDASHCPNDPGAANNGTCTMSLILENVIHFGCVTTGQAQGPSGSFDLAVLDLIPHPDLVNDIFPGNNNGVVTIIKDNGCEVADTLGHPVVNSANGGQIADCGDLAVTVRILEGDINLDCQVNVDDEAAIATHYGAFFGSLLYSKWLDLEPQFHDLDIDIKDIQKVFGRDGSTCQNPIPAQPPVPFH